MKHERVLGALYGQALGDAMGMPSELWPRSRVKAHFGWIDRFLPGPAENNAACYFDRAEFTDDTSMALCLADAIIECDGQINADVIGRHILHWAESFDAFNKNVLGPTSKIALNAIRDGKPVSALENNGVTNGAAMRASPLGCLLPATRLEHFVEQVALASSPTHKSDLAIAGAVVIAWAISRAIDGERWQNIVDALPGIARYAQEAKPTTFSASLAARIELALHTVRNAKGSNPPASRFINSSGRAPVPLNLFRQPLRWSNWQEPIRTAAPFYVPTWAVILTPSARWQRLSAARCMACRRLIRRLRMNSMPLTSSTLVITAKNYCTTGSKGRAYDVRFCPSP
jgi:ADP-ribosylglycohydrolase